MATKKPQIDLEAVAKNKEAFSRLIRLYEIAYGYEAKDFKRKPARSFKPIMVSNSSSCLLCSENTNLEKAHIIPIHIYVNAEIEDTIPDYLRHAVYLCPSHHKAYDKYNLKPRDKSLMRAGIKDSGYIVAFQELLSNMAVIEGASSKALKQLDESLTTAWKWWREYCYGN